MKKELVTGWGRVVRNLADVSSYPLPYGIARGNGMSYGDSALSDTVSRLKGSEFHFDEATGLIICDSGLTIREVLHKTCQKGWSLPVVSGSSLVTIGGALASDIHGKNHESKGSFSRHVLSFEILTGRNEVILVSRTQNADLFKATAGGMGLTGVILTVTIQLERISSTSFYQSSKKTFSLEDFLHQANDSSSPYLNGWLHPMERGMAILFEQAPLSSGKEQLLFSSKDVLAFDLWNPVTKRIINSCYFHMACEGQKKVSMTKALFPLEGLPPYHRTCGQHGLIQFHAVVDSKDFTYLVDEIYRLSPAPILMSFKKYGPGNGNLLSFARLGRGIAVDYVHSPESLATVQRLNQVVSELKGKVYLTKDSTLSKAQFQTMYPEWTTFQLIREKYGSLGTFHSLQSKRLGLN